ncbi:MAG: efflux RND transporter periplasmic adaptor subunit [Planctomycetota bacterium]|nr:efflux RND transporter periplasmic adaptor subunit [Planctomycetota bacterium]
MKRVLVLFVVVAGLIVLGLAIHAHFEKGTAPSMGGEVKSSAAKQLWTCKMDPQIVQDHPGLCPVCSMPLTPLASTPPQGELLKPATATSQPQILYYWDPMLGPSSISSKPGKSAMGMDMVPVYAEQTAAGPAVVIDPAVVQNMGVQTAKVTRGALIHTVRVVGMVGVPEASQYDVNLRVNGWIEKLYANQEGMHVHKGEALFDIYSPDLQIAEEELIGAVAAMKPLDDAANGSARSDAQTLVDSAKRKLRLWGVAEQDIDAIAAASKPPQTVPFRSPADGAIEEKMVVQGSAVQSGMKLMRIEDHSKLWLQAQVYEQQLLMVKLGQIAEATFESQPGKTFSGPIDFIYPHLDHDTRTVMVRITLDNADEAIKPGMYATVKIMTKPLEDALLAPREAVIDTGTRQIAFVVQSAGHFEPRNVRMGLLGDDDRVQILDGLKEGDDVVTSGQFLLDVNSRTDEAIRKLRGSAGGN